MPITQTLAHHSVPRLSVLFIYPGACFSKVPIKAQKVVVVYIQDRAFGSICIYGDTETFYS